MLERLPLDDAIVLRFFKNLLFEAMFGNESTALSGDRLQVRPLYYSGTVYNTVQHSFPTKSQPTLQDSARLPIFEACPFRLLAHITQQNRRQSALRTMNLKEILLPKSPEPVSGKDAQKVVFLNIHSKGGRRHLRRSHGLQHSRCLSTTITKTSITSCLWTCKDRHLPRSPNSFM